VIYDLADEQWTVIASGQLTAPDGTVYHRRTTRTRRQDADALIASGTPLICYWYGGGQLDWHDGDDAPAAWTRLRLRVIAHTPRPDPGGEPLWTAGRWDSDNGHTILVLTGNC
jgi:hypothetical protein